jgi:hypothetical protein
MELEPQHRTSLPDALGMPCAVLSLASGVISFIVAAIVWWRQLQPNIQVIGEQAGLFSSLMGLGLAAIGAASGRKRTRRVAIVAIVVNIAVLSLALDEMIGIVRW